MPSRVPKGEERAKIPKFSSFADGKDRLQAYLQHFERFATKAKWDKTGWATKLTECFTFGTLV